MYKEASKSKLRIATTKGELSVEQLWGLEEGELDSLALRLEEEYKSSKKSKSFLRRKTKADKIVKLKFDIVLDVLNTKLDEAEEAVGTQAIKAREQKLLSLLEEKKDEALKEMSVEDIEKELKKLKK